MRTIIIILGLFLLWSCNIDLLEKDTEKQDIPKPTEAQVTWQDCEVGVIFCLDMPILAGDYTNNNSTREVFDPKLYDPKELDTDQWIKSAKDASAKYAIFTATHFNGFMQWQSDLYPYGLKQAAWRDGKGDIAKDFVESCRKAGIKPGFFFSTHRNAYWTVWGHYVDWGEGKGTTKQEEFNRVAEKMAGELWSRYGPLVQVWFDAGVKLPHEGGPDVLPVFEKYQSGSVFYNSSLRSDHRWVGNEAGYANYPCWATLGIQLGQVNLKGQEKYQYLATGDPDGSVWAPAMVDVPLRGANGIHNWFWNPGQDSAVYPPEELVKMYYNSVGRNSNFIIGAVIDTNGLVPECDCNALKTFGDEISRIFSNPVAETSGKEREIILELPSARQINHIVIQEDIRKGERVREYTIEAYAEGKWQKVAGGSCIGHKRIHKLTTFMAEKIRLTITKSIAKPKIKKLSLYYAALDGRTAVPEFSGKSFSYQELAGQNPDGSRGIGMQEGVTRRDPSDVIKVDNTYYIWYSKVTHADVAANEQFLRASGYVATLWYATSQDEGHTWVEQGEALGVGKEGAFDAQAVFTPNILKFNNRYYLYYDAVKPTAGGTDDLFENNSTTDFTNMGVAVADSPDGTWKRISSEPILRYNPDGKSFDSYRVDDSGLVIRDGRIWLYYKGRNLRDGSRGPGRTKMGVAFAEKPEGPYTKYMGNPILDKSHEVFVWSHREGIAAYASLSKTLEYAHDGLDFTSNPVGIETLPKPIAPGAFRPELTEPLQYGHGIQWGISMQDPGGPYPYLVRWECDLSSPALGAGQSEKNESKIAKLIWNYDNRFDVDVILPGKSIPACRLLLPESIYMDGLKEIPGVHTHSAVWKESGRELQGAMLLDQGAECGLWLKPTAEGVLMKISIKNTSQNTYRDVRVDICAGISHLPNAENVDWSNRDFIPDSIPLDRTLQGKYWYRVVTPKRLKAWTPDKDWIVMHARPENPEPVSENLYWHVVSQTDNSLGCAVMSTDGKKIFYQVWKTEHSRHQSPFAGNACMHLIPQVAKELPPGKAATIEGKAGIFEGTWEELAAEFKKFIYPQKKVKASSPEPCGSVQSERQLK